MAIVARVMNAGTLARRVLAAGIFLFVGLPALTVFLYALGYPATHVPLPVITLVDGLQVVIIAYAVIVGSQLVAYAAAVARPRRRAPGAVPPAGDARPWPVPAPLSGSPPDGWAPLRDWTLRLADLIWRQEQRGRPEFGPAALAYVRDAVMLEVEYRRRAAALRRRALELETWTAQDGVVASERM